MGKIQSKAYSLRRLFSKLESGDFALPEIQRKFVWNKQRICDLMDSVFRDYPIGTTLIWTAPYSKSIQLRPNTKSIIPTSARGSKKYLIIDGQQRMTAIYGIMSGHKGLEYNDSQIDFGDLYFVCDPRATKRFKFSNKLADTVGYIRLTDALVKSPSQLINKFKLKKYEQRELHRLVKAFSAYRFYLLFYTGSGLEKDIREIFVRINSKGMTVSRADILFARANNVRLRDLVYEARRSLANGFDSLPVDELQNTLFLAYGANRLGGQGATKFLTKIERNQKERNLFTKNWKFIRRGYENSVDFLVQNKKRPTRHQTAELKKWFWHTACGNRYSGAAFNKNIPADIKFFKDLAHKQGRKYSLNEKLDSLEFLKTSYKGAGGSASTSAYFILLESKSPKYLDTGADLILDRATARVNRKDRHHIFPSDLLRRHSISSKWSNSIVNICLLGADQNRSFGAKHPSVYLAPFRRKRHFSRVMKSHLIPHHNSSPIWDRQVSGSFLEFLNLRGYSIITAIEKEAGSERLFDRPIEIKRLRGL